MQHIATLEGLYTAAQCRALDSTAIEREGIPGIQLMARAGRVCFEALCERWGQPDAVHVFCGTGNNGGDGYIIASLAKRQCLPVTVYQVGDVARIDGDARLAMEQAISDGVIIEPFSPGNVPVDGVIVDALLGTGINGELKPDYREAIDAMNTSDLPVLAVDVPSGLSSDTGAIAGAAVRADLTVTLIAMKRGLFTAEAADYVGALLLHDLAVPVTVYDAIPTYCRLAALDWALEQLPARRPTVHKGEVGRVLVIGGDHGYGGAGILAAQAAARSGAGLIQLATRAEHIAPALARCPELLVSAVDGRTDAQGAIDAADVLVIGPGLGLSAWSEQLFDLAASADTPQVIDADGLNLLARGDLAAPGQHPARVLTPHPGEAARLLGVSTAQVQADRFAAVETLVERYGGVAVLKGSGTLINDGEHTVVCDVGCSGMASGGMGDVLSGVIAALMGQGMSPMMAAILGVQVHGIAAEQAADAGERGLLASDLLPFIRELLA